MHTFIALPLNCLTSNSGLFARVCLLFPQGIRKKNEIKSHWGGQAQASPVLVFLSHTVVTS